MKIYDKAKYRIGITRTDLLCPGTQDYYVIEERLDLPRGERQWSPLTSHPIKGREIIMPYPLWQYREACELFIKLCEWEENNDREV